VKIKDKNISPVDGLMRRDAKRKVPFDSVYGILESCSVFVFMMFL